MKFRWVLTLLLGVMLVGPLVPARAQQQLSTDPIRVLEQTGNGLTVEFSAAFLDFQQTAAYTALIAPEQSNSTRQGTLPGVSVFPTYSALIGLPPTGTVELQFLTDESLPLSDARLLAAGSTESVTADRPVRLVDEAWVRDRRVARLEFRPFQMQTGGQSALWHQNLRVTLRFSTIPFTAAASAGADAALAGQLLNAVQAQGWRAATLPAGVVSDPFANAPGTQLGPRYKVVVDTDGLYQLTATDLQTAGLDLATLDPRKLHFYSQGLVVPITILGEADGHFDATDTLLFYGQKFRGDRLAARHPEESSYYSTLTNGWHPQFNAVQVEKYTAENVYWLTVEATPGLRIGELDAPPTAAPAGTVSRETVHFEESNFWWTWHYTSEDTWFWDRLRDQLDHSYNLSLPNPASSSIQGIRIQGELVVRSPNTTAAIHHTKILFNSFLVEDATWGGSSRHHFSAFAATSDLAATNTLHVQSLTANMDIYLDWIEVDYDRNLTAISDTLAFTLPAGAGRSQVGGFTAPQVELWDISQPLQPVRLKNFTYSAGTLDFETPLTANTRFVAAGTAAWKTPKRVEYYNPPDLTSAALGADYVIITHASFVAAAQRLADFRKGQGLRVQVVDFADLVNQFNDGIYHPIAIKNFLAYAFLHWQAPAPAYAVLIGDGNWNLRRFNPAVYGNAPIYLPPNLAWVDYQDITTTNQGEVESTNLLANVVGLDPLPDLSIGRIPVNNLTEVNGVIDKILNYEQAPANQDWQKRFLFVAGSVPDSAGDFQQISNSIITDYIKPPYQALTAFQAGTTSVHITAQTDAIISGLNLGALVVSYVGHGSVQGWGDMFNITNFPNVHLGNSDRLPLVLSLTCSDGYWMMPPGTSLPTIGFAEKLLREANQGAIATFSPSGFDDVYGHDQLQRGFMTALFKFHVTNVGALTNAARLQVYTAGSNVELIHQFILFGDPALRLKLPFSNTYLPTFHR